MAECCLSMVEEGIFHPRQVERVRMVLNRLPEARRTDGEFLELAARLRELEKRNGEPGDAPNDGPATPVADSDTSGGGRHRRSLR